jgi:ABC-type methionine transport system ATPase subunit
MGFLRSDEGQVSVDGLDLNAAGQEQLEAFRKRLGVVFQGAALLNSLTVLENVGLPLIEVDHRPKEEVRARVIEALRKVYLPAEEILDLKPSSLSGGMRKRVGIARAIIQKPEIILYDEPTTGLDPVTVSGVNQLTLELQHTRLELVVLARLADEREVVIPDAAHAARGAGGRALDGRHDVEGARLQDGGPLARLDLRRNQQDVPQAKHHEKGQGAAGGKHGDNFRSEVRDL